MNRTENLTKVNVKTPTYRFYLTLKQHDYQKLVELTKTLGMSKTKIVRLMIINNSDIILCNTVELLRLLDLLGKEVAEIRKKIEPIHDSISTTLKQYSPTENHLEWQSMLLDYYDLQKKIELSFRELLKVLKKMK